MKFSHQIITESSYSLMLDSQKREVHLAIANEYENLDVHKDNDIDEMLVKSTILHGKLTEVVKQSEDPLILLNLNLIYH